MWLAVREGDLATRGMLDGLGYAVVSGKNDNKVLLKRVLAAPRKLPTGLPGFEVSEQFEDYNYRFISRGVMDLLPSKKER